RPERLAPLSELIFDDAVTRRHFSQRRLRGARIGVTQATGAPDTWLGVATDPDRWVRFLHRPDVRLGSLQLPEAALEGHLILGPQALHEDQRLVQPRASRPTA